ncbi:MFS transporter [Phytomonospora sp. NPDC050363]|uniref:MFS transporter n=1 Tax=Phytomonospora sp. NPDC050363 TaxID=3155642 RepID=UPI0033D9C92D
MNPPTPSIRPALPTLLALAAAIFVSGTAEYLVAGMLTELSGSLGVGTAAAGQLVTGYALTVLIGGPLLTVATTRLPRKGLMLALTALFVAGAVVCATADGYGQLLAGRVISALAQATLFASALTTGAKIVAPQRIGTAFAIMSTGLTLATVLGSPLGTFLGQEYGWRSPFLAVAVMGALSLIPLALLVPRTPRPESTVARELRVLAGRDTRRVLLLTVLSQAAVSSVFVYLAPSATELAGFTAGAVPLLLLGYGAGGFVGNLVAGRAADRDLGRTLFTVLGATALLLAAAPFALTMQATAIAEILLLGAVANALAAPLQSLMSRRTGGSSLALAVNVSAFMGGHALAAASAGVVVAAWDLRWAGLAGVVFAVVALGVAPRERRVPVAV